MDLYIGHNRPPFVEFGAELLPDFILRKDPNRCSEVRPRGSEPRTGSNALKRGQGALNAGRGDLNVRNNQGDSARPLFCRQDVVFTQDFCQVLLFGEPGKLA